MAAGFGSSKIPRPESDPGADPGPPSDPDPGALKGPGQGEEGLVWF
jgi:hypothetical protein